ncbi:branched-chain amino acid ABC transporter substrate-binding protein [Desulfogranum mediterraneum]|uniref:branched-chain amino acid ABC transporter substrate-binding protein n=1 Tax=Desulfogranum mediterraneum TaxID=160661 RepID=UPI001ABFABCE|nr:branched-chain amino acid ABC transporter substrate-binding protein [Desulfogranum mediterraneum]
MKKSMLTAALGCALTGLFMLGQAATAADLKIGIMVPTTGSEATAGKDMENAILLAADEINQAGGVLGMKITTTTGDDACDPQQATAAASKLVSADVAAVVGGYCSGATLPTLKLYGDAGVPFIIAASNSTKLIDANQGNAFLVNSTGYDQVNTAVELFTSKGANKLAIIHQGDGYSEDLAKLTKEKWSSLGKEVVAYEVVNKGEQDHSSLVTRIKSKAPDAIFWTAYYADGALVIKQLRQAGYRKLIAVGDGSNSPKLLEIGGKATEGVFCFSNPTVDYLPAAKAFSEAYKKKYDQDPDAYSSLAYDGMKLMADAIQRAGSTDKAAIIKAIAATKDFKGIAGPISFTPKNTLAHSNFVTLIAKGGKWVLNK